MWGLGRRTALFIVSYSPLAAMFLALHWPKGWATDDLARLGCGVVAVAVLTVALFGLAFTSAAR